MPKLRTINKPTTAKFNIQEYVRYLISEPMRTSCAALSEILPDVSHDSINRFLLRENYAPEDLWKEFPDEFDLKNGTLSTDDTVLDKPYSNEEKAKLISRFYSGKHHCVVKGINLLTLYYTDPNGVSAPVNYRVIDPDEDKTKNELFREMLQEVMDWGLEPSWVTGDCWYSSKENLRFIRKYKLSMLFGIAGNRNVSLESSGYLQVQKIKEWNKDGLIVHLRGFGEVKVLRTECKKSFRYYIVSVPEIENLPSFVYKDFERIHKEHWNIESFHRAVKQLCSIEKFQVRTTVCIKNHIFCSLVGFIKLECAKISNVISNWYKMKTDLFRDVVRNFIARGIDGEKGSKLIPSVNA